MIWPVIAFLFVLSIAFFVIAIYTDDDHYESISYILLTLVIGVAFGRSL